MNVNEIVDAEVVNQAEANQIYGALTEGFYLASFTFKRAMARTLRLLKDGGWRQVGAGFDDVNDFVRSLQLDRFKVVADRRKEFIERVKELQPAVSNRAIADALGVDRRTIDRDRGANAPPGAQNAQQNGEPSGANAPPGAGDGRRDARIITQRDTREERREEKLKGIEEAAILTGRYPVIYADPAWEDEFGDDPRQTELHYPVMPLDDIKALPVAEISAPDAVLYLWALPHMRRQADAVMEAWGFECRSEIIWVKDKIGLGEWVRNQHEILLIGRRGAFPPPPTAVRSSSVVTAPRGEHSAKPEVFLELVERWYGDMPKIELFRRGPARPGWKAWGNEVKAA
jgi:N6-adenosine-specific RNA methylase IME4